MTLFTKLMTVSVLALSLAACSGNDTPKTQSTGLGKSTQTSAPKTTMRDQIKIVGSSTVYPFATTVAENFGRTTKFKTPIVESTGSGGGLKLFCTGLGANNPDITNASRRIKQSEIKRCADNKVTEIVEAKIGYDGIVIANSRKSPLMKLSLKDVYLALAKDIPDGKGGTKPNTYKTWHEINPSLPDVKIEVMGPPPTSGTRDAFVELAMDGGCKKFPEITALKKTNKKSFKSLCHALREDGAFIEAGENDNLIVQKLEANPSALGIFGYSYLEENGDMIQGSEINGSAPTFEHISDGSYPVSRPLFFYVKKVNVPAVAGMKEYIAEFMSDRATGPDGYLVDRGLIPMSEAEHKEWEANVLALKLLDPAEIHE